MSKKANLELIKALVEQGKTVKEIAIESGYADGTIRKHLKEMGIRPASKKAYIDDKVIQEIIHLNKEGLTNKQIGEKLGMNAVTVRKYLQENNIEFNSERTKRITDKELILTNEQLEIIYGSLLGDAYIGINWKNARVSFNHGGDQEDYFDYKCSFFTGLLGKINKTPRYDKRTDKYYNKFAVRLLAHPKFTEIYNECYINGVKTVSKEWLDKITPRGLAFWFMDDGTNSGLLATNSFSYEEVNLIQNWFKEKWNINTTIHHQKAKNGVQYLIYIKAESRPIFYELVKPYIIPSMEYKFENWNP